MFDNTITDTAIVDALGYVPYDAQNPDQFLVKNDIIKEFNFSSSTQWNISHTLVNPAPNVVVITSGGNVIKADVQYPTHSSITISFANPTSGKAILS